MPDMVDVIPHIQQFIGTWSIEPNAARQIEQTLRVPWAQHVREFQSRVDEGAHASRGHGFELTPEGVAIIDLEGALTKYGSSLSSGGSTVRFRQTLREVARQHESGHVKAAMLVIESPGGTTMGTAEAAAEVAKLAKSMPVWTFFEDIGASAAYWIGSQATHVVANASALVGSIGTYFAIDDVSGAFTAKGIKTHLFTTGPHKGAGYMGTELSEDQITEFQSMVERMNKPFVQAVAKARDLKGESLDTVTTGQVWRGDEAVAVGLIDAVMSYDDALAELSSSTNTTSGASTMPKPRATSKTTAKSEAIKAKSEDEKPEDAEMEEDEEMESEDTTEEETEAMDDEKKPESSKPTPGEKAASLAELKAELPKAGSDFYVEALEAGWSTARAHRIWSDRTIESQEKRIKELESQGPKPGSKPLGTGNTGKGYTGADPKAEFEAAVKEKVDGGMSRQKAVSAVNREQPELRQAYVEAINAKN